MKSNLLPSLSSPFRKGVPFSPKAFSTYFIFAFSKGGALIPVDVPLFDTSSGVRCSLFFLPFFLLYVCRHTLSLHRSLPTLQEKFAEAEGLK